MKNNKRPLNKATIKAIKSYWLSDDGQHRLKEIDQRLSLNVGARVNVALNDDRTRCWACLKIKHKVQRCHIIPDFCGGSPKAENLILMCYGCHLDSPTMNHPDPIWVWMNELILWDDEVSFFLEKFIAQSKLSEQGVLKVISKVDDRAYPSAIGLSAKAMYSIWVIRGLELEESRPDLIKPKP